VDRWWGVRTHIRRTHLLSLRGGAMNVTGRCKISSLAITARVPRPERRCRRRETAGCRIVRRYTDDITFLETAGTRDTTRDRFAGVFTATKSRRIPIAHPVLCTRSAFFVHGTRGNLTIGLCQCFSTIPHHRLPNAATTWNLPSSMAPRRFG